MAMSMKEKTSNSQVKHRVAGCDESGIRREADRRTSGRSRTKSSDSSGRTIRLAGEFRFHRSRPRGVDLAVRRFLFHGHRHGILLSNMAKL